MIKKGQIAAISATLVLTLAIYNCDRTPDGKIQQPAEQTEANTSEENHDNDHEGHDHSEDPLDAKVEKAVEIIQSGSGQPMQAIGLLREVIQVDSNHIGANYWLGEFSVMSGQFDKAVQRFTKLAGLEPDNPVFCIKLAQAYDGAGQTQKGVDVLNEFLENHPSEEIKQQVEPVLKELSIKL